MQPRRLAAALSCVAIAACARLTVEPVRAGPAPSASAPASVARAPAGDAALARETPEAGAPAPPPKHLQWVRSVAAPSEDGSPYLDGDGAAAWFTKRGATAPEGMDAAACREVRAGDEAALLCEVTSQRSRGSDATLVYRVVDRKRIYVVRHARAVTIFDEPFAVSALDTDDPTAGPLFQLVLELSERQITLREPAPGACDDAARTLSSDLARAAGESDVGARVTLTSWARFDESLRRELCGAIGSYALTGARFVRR